MIGYIIIGVTALFIFLVYIVILLSCVGYSKAYKEATKTNATILEDLGDLKLATGSFSPGTPRFRIFHQYKVSFMAKGTIHTEIVNLKNRNLQVGDITEIRYDITKDGKVSTESEAFLYWSREMAVGYTIGLILGIVLSILKIKDTL